MKNKILFSIVLISLLITHCKKETTNKPGNTTYSVDSIQVFEDSVHTSTITKNGHDWPNFSSFYAPNASNFVKTISADTTKYIETAYRNFDTLQPWFTSIDLQLKGALPIYFNTIGNVEGIVGQNGAENTIASFKYDANRIKEIKKSFTRYHSFRFESDNILEEINDSLGFQYIGNELTKIVNKTVVPTSYFPLSTYDAKIEYTSTISNQKDLIGIDVNDLILSAFGFYIPIPIFGLVGFSSNGSPGGFYSVDPSTEILNNLSCNTNSDKLIEKVNYSNYTISGTSFPNFSIDINYTFDSSFNNRVKELNFVSFSGKKNTYKLFYHP